MSRFVRRRKEAVAWAQRMHSEAEGYRELAANAREHGFMRMSAVFERLAEAHDEVAYCAIELVDAGELDAAGE